LKYISSYHNCTLEHFLLQAFQSWWDRFISTCLFMYTYLLLLRLYRYIFYLHELCKIM
jgi:hypothetical protein